jgi:hypothetical protein
MHTTFRKSALLPSSGTSLSLPWQYTLGKLEKREVICRYFIQAPPKYGVTTLTIEQRFSIIIISSVMRRFWSIFFNIIMALQPFVGFWPLFLFLDPIQVRWPPLWSSGQSSWLQIRRPGFDSRHYQIFWGGGRKTSSGPGTGSTQLREYNWGANW